VTLETDDATLVRVMKAIAGTPGADDGVDPDELFFMRLSDGSLRVLAMCSDRFAWATADAEKITADNIAVFEQAVRDVVTVDLWEGYALLFAVRMRNQMPMPAARKVIDPKLWQMFEDSVTDVVT
jgi:hypothetical protein